MSIMPPEASLYKSMHVLSSLSAIVSEVGNHAEEGSADYQSREAIRGHRTCHNRCEDLFLSYVRYDVGYNLRIIAVEDQYEKPPINTTGA